MSWSLLSQVMPDIKQNYLDESRKTKSIAYFLYLNEYLATPTIFPTFRKGFWVLLMGLIVWRACFHHQKWTNTTNFENSKIDREKNFFDFALKLFIYNCHLPSTTTASYLALYLQLLYLLLSWVFRLRVSMELISFMILPIFIALADQSEVSIFNKRYSAIFAPGVYSTY